MSGSYRLLILFCLLFVSSAQALEVFFDPVYWRATETVDWAYTNNEVTSNQNIAFKTIDFDYAPGFRVGVGYNQDTCENAWDTMFYYTRYYTKETDSASGNLVSAFLGGKFVQGNNFFYQSGQVNHTINFNMFDWDLASSIFVTDAFMLRPVIGLRGGLIHQKVITDFQGQISITENVKNNFKGIGPKVGIESRWAFCDIDGYQFSLFSDFTTSYMWGRWRISDMTHDSLARTRIIKVGSRDFGAFTLQGVIGLNLDYKCFSMKLGYEIGDWFNQYQVLDDATGAHNNDLVLQGITLRFSYDF